MLFVNTYLEWKGRDDLTECAVNQINHQHGKKLPVVLRKQANS
jgi:hypothetical protein